MEIPNQGVEKKGRTAFSIDLPPPIPVKRKAQPKTEGISAQKDTAKAEGNSFPNPNSSPVVENTPVETKNEDRQKPLADAVPPAETPPSTTKGGISLGLAASIDSERRKGNLLLISVFGFVVFIFIIIVAQSTNSTTSPTSPAKVETPVVAESSSPAVDTHTQESENPSPTQSRIETAASASGERRREPPRNIGSSVITPDPNSSPESSHSQRQEVSAEISPSPLPEHVIKDSDGKLRPAPGYKWANSNDNGDDLRVVPDPEAGPNSELPPTSSDASATPDATAPSVPWTPPGGTTSPDSSAPPGNRPHRISRRAHNEISACRAQIAQLQKQLDPIERKRDELVGKIAAESRHAWGHYNRLKEQWKLEAQCDEIQNQIDGLHSEVERLSGPE